MNKPVSISIAAQPITASGFAPFGELLVIPQGANRLDHAASLMNPRTGARLNLALVRPPVAALPMTVSLMERHRFSTQAFLPLEGRAYIVLVAPAGPDEPDPSQAQAFIVPGHLGICYRTGIWHMGMATLSAEGSMAMLVHQDGSEDDTDYRAVTPLLITGPSDQTAKIG